MNQETFSLAISTYFTKNKCQNIAML